MPNYYYTSTGEKVSQSTIDRRRSETYRRIYEGNPHPICRGCGLTRAQGSAHIVPQHIAKKLHKSELCWLEENIFPACNICNSVAENPSSSSIRELRNFDEILRVTEKYDPERAEKMKG